MSPHSIFDEADYIRALREVRAFNYAEIERAVVGRALGLPSDVSLPGELLSNRHELILREMGYCYKEYTTKRKITPYKVIPTFQNQPFKSRYLPDLDRAVPSSRLDIDAFLGNYVVQLLHQLGFDRFFYDVIVAANTRSEVAALLSQLAPSPGSPNEGLAFSPSWYHVLPSFAAQAVPSSGRLVFHPDDDRAYLFIQHGVGPDPPSSLDLRVLQDQAQTIIIHELLHFYLYHFIFKRLAHCQHSCLEMAGPLIDSLALACLYESFATMQTAAVQGPEYLCYFKPEHTVHNSTKPVDVLLTLPSFWAQTAAWRRRKRESWEKLFIFKHYLPWIAACWAIGDSPRATQILKSPAFPEEFRLLTQALKEPILDLYHKASLDFSTFLTIINEIETKGPMNIIYDAYTFNEFIIRHCC